MEQRAFQRFPLRVKLEILEKDNTILSGLVKDFSRHGLGAIFDKFDFEKNIPLILRIQTPVNNLFIPACGEVMWKRPFNGKWEVGFKLREFPPEAKADLLEYAYQNWLKEKASL